MLDKSLVGGIVSFSWDIVKIIIISLVIIVPIRYFLVQPFFVRGASMDPSYHQGDYLLVDEISYRFGDPERGSVIIFKFPGNPSVFYIKRIIGLPGETITIRDGEVIIKNEQSPEGFVLEEKYIKEPFSDDMNVVLGDGEYFVLGDNRNASHDSRRWGALHESFIVGRVFLRAWPLDDVGLIIEPVYSK
ncbi:MAG: signal peptidase I [Candidatus Spechtbacteria bacterium RIFCSPLOWO2_01_FULL_43_12]|uniref:Signal peptidase I n=1 Tax=Candidatus Spechtbacteria bacterium RIFCSPLOWO2_01_FULL_43_12 TaxID=1802162 RepID=A0A1G2HF36_9BACT|nr:MAG: signal peptidase I [Candidatus Spechtbacteria bacterium RIFCSPLOWO2_01_FULL_43_12]